MKRLISALMIVCMVIALAGCAAPVSVNGAQIDDDGHLIFSMSDGSTFDVGTVQGEKGEKGEKGDTGAQGPQGIQGVSGSDGIGILKAAVNDNGHLMIRLTDGTLIDTGYVMGANGTDGADGADGADGTDGADGAAGQTPIIGDNGNWWIGTTDTGVIAKGNDFIFNDGGNGTVLLAYVGQDENVVIPDGTTLIGESAFANNQIIKRVTMPETVKAIENYAFYKCKALEHVTLPQTLLYIGEYAFADSIILDADGNLWPDVVQAPFTLNFTENNSKIIGDYAFSNSRISGEITLYCPGGLYNGVFKDCRFLEKVNLPNATWIGDETFYACYSLNSVNMPNINGIGERAFTHTAITDLSNVNVYYIGTRAFFASALQHVDISCSGYISNEAFSGCHDLVSVSLSDVERIGEDAFNYCESLESIDLPSTLQQIEKGAFSGCIALATVTCRAENPPRIGYELFDDCSSLNAIYVPSASVSRYKNAMLGVPLGETPVYMLWSSYADKIQAIVP